MTTTSDPGKWQPYPVSCRDQFPSTQLLCTAAGRNYIRRNELQQAPTQWVFRANILQLRQEGTEDRRTHCPQAPTPFGQHINNSNVTRKFRKTSHERVPVTQLRGVYDIRQQFMRMHGIPVLRYQPNFK